MISARELLGDPRMFVIGLTSLCEPGHSYLQPACGIKAPEAK